jgi:3-mercaptopyruvate sulfurtransferase SseA
MNNESQQNRVLNGGIVAWKNVGGQIEQEIHKYEPSIFIGNPTISFIGHELILA